MRMANYLQLIPVPRRTTSFLLLLLINILVTKGFSSSQPLSNISKPNGWRHWSEWSTCSKTCLGGIYHRSRTCTWPPKGDTILSTIQEVECQGNSIEYKICNTQPCPETALDSRSLQCHSHNGRIVRGRKITQWEPSNNGYNLCELNCYSPQYGFSYSFGKVEDGTPCYEAANSKICLNGRCMPLGCDSIVGSMLKNDMCGICGGKNLTCQRIAHIFHKWSNVKSGYSEVVKIPANSRSIIIRDNSRNYIALFDSSRSSIINGNGLIDPPGHYGAAGAIFEYSGAHDRDEILRAKGPTQFDIFVMVLIRDQSPKIHYEYWVPLPGTGVQEIRMQATASRLTTPAPVLKHTKIIPKYDFFNAAKERPNRPLATQKGDFELKKKKQKKPRLGNNAKQDKSCPPCSRARNIKQQFCESDFVLRVLVMNSETIKRETRYHLQVLQSYKNLVPLQTFEYLWILDNCKCPKMARFREYLLMGKIDKSVAKREVRLVLHRHSYIRRYNQKRALKVLQIKREEGTLCGNDRRKNRI